MIDITKFTTEELMQLTPEMIQEIRRKKLKEHVINILKETLDKVEKDNFEIDEYKVFRSTAGDGWGDENHCIDFGYDNKQKDFEQILSELNDY